MTRKDYVAIAKAINNIRHGHYATITQIADGIANYMTKENPQFNRERFLDACRAPMQASHD